MIVRCCLNSVYGKNAQNVIDKSSWSAFDNDMVALGCSAITNPFSAMMITALVRCELLAAQNQCESLGYKSLSVTTDGFISDMPFDTLKSLDLYGLKSVMGQVRIYLTDGKSDEMWEIKHAQDDLVNLCTRGNVSLFVKDPDHGVLGGVCAHNSTKSGFDKEDPDYEVKDRHWLYHQSISRTGAVECLDKQWTKFKDLARGADFVVTDAVRNIRMDFDLKRMPVRESFEKVFVPLDGTVHEMMNFTTMPFETLDEFKKYRAVKKNVPCLRTETEWGGFFRKIFVGGGNAKHRDLDRAIILSIVSGHRARYWCIPELDRLRGAARIDWINSVSDSTQKFSSNDWKNAGRKDRLSTILDKSLLIDKLNELGCAS